jgi:hypothetical protein
MPIEISEDVLENDEFLMITDLNGDLVLEHKPTGGQFKFDSVDGSWTPVQGLSMDGADIDAAGNIDVSQSVVTQDLTVNGSATGVGVALESTDSLVVEDVNFDGTSKSLISLFSGSSTTVFGGTAYAQGGLDWKYTFADGNTINLKGGDNYDRLGSVGTAVGTDATGDDIVVAPLPPAKEVTAVDVGANNPDSSNKFGAYLLRL